MTNTTTNIIRVFSTDNVPESISMTIAVPQMGESSSNEQVVTEEMGESEQQETTNFTSDGNVVKDVALVPSSLPSLLHQSSEVTNSNDIVKFLGKPYRWWSGFLNTSGESTATPIVSLANPEGILASPIFANKLSGFMGFRATTVVRIVINATPFHMGRYMLVYVPLGGARVSASVSSVFNSHVNTLYERTQLHRVELDVTCDTEAVIRVPFNSALNYFPLRTKVRTTDYGTLGSFILYPYSSLQTVGGSSRVGVTLYTHFEDVELIGAAVPQMGISPTEKESKAAGLGPVSSVAFTIGGVAKAVSHIPLLSAYASTTSWAMDILGNAAKAVGFSKPLNHSAPMRTQVTMGANMGNVDGYDQSITLGTSGENLMSIMPGVSGTDIDEMGINHIASIPAWFKTVTWADSALSGDSLVDLRMRPVDYCQLRTIASKKVYNFTPLAFSACFFKYWRGSLVFKIKLVKTIFHSGRISIAFSPFDSKSSTNPLFNFDSSDYLHREIVDIRTCNEITFTVPYINPSSWLSMHEPFGAIQIFVVDPLTAPSNVPSSIKLLMEVSGGEDFEVAFPIGTPSEGYDFCSGGLSAWGVVPQMGEEEPCELLDTVIGSATSPHSTLINSEACIGEKIQSFRALTKIFQPQRLDVLELSSKVESIYPFACNALVFLVDTWVVPAVRGDMLDILSACYLYSRGSYRFKKVTPTMTNINNSITYVKHRAGSYDTYFKRDISDLSSGYPNYMELAGGKFANFNMGPMNGITEITVPQMTMRHSRLVSCESIATASYGTTIPLNCGIQLNTYFNSYIGDYSVNQQDSGFVNYRASGEDFSLGGFISTPQVVFDSTPGFL